MQIVASEATCELLNKWKAAARRFQLAEEERASAEGELKAATNALGRWMAPEDAHVDEVFYFWDGPGLLAIKPVTSDRSEFKIWWRTKKGSRHL